MSIITYPLNGITYSATDAETYLCSRSSGVFASTGNFAISYSSPASTTVTIGTGLAWIHDGDFSGKSICSNAAVTLELPTAETANSRYDRIVLRFDKTKNASNIVVIKGTAAASPKAPAIVRNASYYDLGLYLVYRGAGTTTVTAGSVTNTMSDETVCGIMSDGVTGIPTSTIYEQWEELYEKLKTELENLDIDVIPAQNASFDDSTAKIGATNVQKALELLKTQADDTQDELDDYEANTALKKLGTMTYTASGASGTTTYTSTDGFRDLILRYSGSGLNYVRISVNDSDFIPFYTTSAGTVPGYMHLKMIGQFCRIQNMQDEITDDSPVRMIAPDSTCKLTKLAFKVVSNTETKKGTIVVWGR